MTTRFKPNPNIVIELFASVAFHRMMDRIAGAGLESADRHVPVGETGDLKRSLHVEKDGENRRIVAGTDHWMFPEFGTIYQAPQPYLRPLIAELNLKVGR